MSSRGTGWAHEVVPGLVAAAISGAPSTAHAALTGRSPLDAARAAGTLVLPRRAGPRVRLVAGGIVHVAVSLLWSWVLVRLLPRRHPVAWGAAAGLAIAALDFGLLGRRRPAVRALPLVPQLADHALFGATVGATLTLVERRARGARTA